MEVPMLDEREFAEVAGLYSEAMRGTKRFRLESGASLEHPHIDDLFKPVRDRYEQLAGMKETNHNAIMHHRISLYGPPCANCGKPLRTPTAKLCGSCMSQVKNFNGGA
jgi:hypothetical protein